VPARLRVRPAATRRLRLKFHQCSSESASVINHRQVRQSTRISQLLASLVCLSGSLLSGRVNAQSASPVGLQASAFTTLVTVNSQRVTGVGVEPQLRLNKLGRLGGGALSLGVGAQYSRHSLSDGPLTVTGIFVEPRLAFGTPRPGWFGYWSARAARLYSSKEGMAGTTGVAFGAGGGLIRVLSTTKNLDVGASALYQQLNDTRTDTGRLYRFGGGFAFVARVGLNFSLPFGA
jgi:hypothetical protein